MKLQSSLLLMSLLILCSCAGMGHKIDTNRAKAIKKMAIVAVEIQQQKPTDNLGLGALKQLKDGQVDQAKEMQQMARNVSQSLIEQLKTRTGWQVLKMDDVIANPDYKKKVATAMSGMRRTLFADNNTEGIYMNNALDAMAFRNMSLEERQALAKSLGVDALAELIVFNNIDQSWMALGHISGDADFTFTGRANLQVYDNLSTDPVWVSQNNDGEKTVSSGTLAKGMSKIEKLSKLGEEASNSAIKKLIETYPL